MARRHRIRHSFSRRFHRPHKQGIVSKAVNAVTLITAFSPSVGVGMRVIQGSALPQNAPRDIIYGETGFDINSGQWNQQQFISSISVKVAAYAFYKIAKAITRRVKLKL